MGIIEYVIFGFMLLVLVGMLVSFVFLMKDIIKKTKERDELFNSIKQVQTPEEWLILKEKVVSNIADRYKKKYRNQYTHESLYGALTNKAEELLKKK